MIVGSAMIERLARTMAKRNYPGGSDADIDEMWDGWTDEAEAVLQVLREVGDRDDPSRDMLFSQRAKVMNAIMEPGTLLPRIAKDEWMEHQANWQARAVIKAMWQLGWRPLAPIRSAMEGE